METLVLAGESVCYRFMKRLFWVRAPYYGVLLWFSQPYWMYTFYLWVAIVPLVLGKSQLLPRRNFYHEAGVVPPSKDKNKDSQVSVHRGAFTPSWVNSNSNYCACMNHFTSCLLFMHVCRQQPAPTLIKAVVYRLLLQKNLDMQRRKYSSDNNILQSNN